MKLSHECLHHLLKRFDITLITNPSSLPNFSPKKNFANPGPDTRPHRPKSLVQLQAIFLLPSKSPFLQSIHPATPFSKLCIHFMQFPSLSPPGWALALMASPVIFTSLRTVYDPAPFMEQFQISSLEATRLIGGFQNLRSPHFLQNIKAFFLFFLPPCGCAIHRLTNEGRGSFDVCGQQHSHSCSSIPMI